MIVWQRLGDARGDGAGTPAATGAGTASATAVGRAATARGRARRRPSVQGGHQCFWTNVRLFIRDPPRMMLAG
jgi:hypothetical protein